jgi:hypothetical protein
MDVPEMSGGVSRKWGAHGDPQNAGSDLPAMRIRCAAPSAQNKSSGSVAQFERETGSNTLWEGESSRRAAPKEDCG